MEQWNPNINDILQPLCRLIRTMSETEPDIHIRTLKFFFSFLFYERVDAENDQTPGNYM